MGVTLALTEEHWGALTEALDQKPETAAVLVTGLAHGPNAELVFLLRAIHWVEESDYLERGPTGLVIASSGYARGLRKAADDRSVALFVHTHPRGAPTLSPRDEAVHRSLRDPFLIRPRAPWMGSLVLGGTTSEPNFTGVVEDARGTRRTVDRLRIVGQRLQILRAFGAKEGEVGSLFDRQTRAFGEEGQRLLVDLRVGVVGAGGTGSAVAEQLIRLGVGDVIVVDDDRIDEANLTRVHSSTRRDVGAPKVDVVRESAAAIGTGTRVGARQERVTKEDAARTLTGCDIVFGCTDDNAGRAVLSRLAYSHLMLVIDTGVLVAATEGRISGVHGRVTLVGPGAGCLICRGRIDPEGARVDVMSLDERSRLAAEGYVPGLAMPNPSVVSFTTVTAALAVSELLERLFGYGDTPRPSELLLRLHERRIRANSVPGVAGHYCTDRAFWGRGDREPFLGQLWA